MSHASVMPFGKNFKISASGLSGLLNEGLEGHSNNVGKPKENAHVIS